MTAKVSLDDQLLKQLQETGEVRVEDIHGVPIVLMTVDAREQLGLVYDDTEWTPEEMMAVVAQQLNDSEGWGHPEMDVYDEEYGHLFEKNDGDGHKHPALGRVRAHTGAGRDGHGPGIASL